MAAASLTVLRLCKGVGVGRRQHRLAFPGVVVRRHFTEDTTTSTSAVSVTMKVDDDVVLVAPVPESRYEEVLDHVTPIFLRDEPLSQCFPPCATGARAADFREYALEQLRSGLSVAAIGGVERRPMVAEHGSDVRGGRVVGSCLNRVLPRRKVIGVDVDTLGEEEDDPLNKNIVRLLTSVHQRVDLFGALGVDEVLEFGIMSVAASHTGRGLAARMVRASAELGARRGYKAAKADATGIASAKSCLRAGLTQLMALPYEDYRPHGELVFKGTQPPNDVLRVLACRLQPLEPYILPLEGWQPQQQQGKM